MKSFMNYFRKPYEELEEALKTRLSGSRVIDLGCGKGTVATLIKKYQPDSVVYCVDHDPQVLREIKEFSFCTDVNEFLAKTDLQVDSIVANAVLHEISTVVNREAYLRWFFRQCLRISKVLLLGDYYYSDEVSDDEVERYAARQLREVGHADRREKFIHPDFLLEVARQEGLQTRVLVHIQAVEDIDRRYYLIEIR